MGQGCGRKVQVGLSYLVERGTHSQGSPLAVAGWRTPQRLVRCEPCRLSL